MIRQLLALTLFTGSAAALELDMPVDCEMGADCYIQSLVDRDPGPGAADFTCGSLSYDGHKGVDFRVATFAEMKAGVDVIAAAPGRIRATRDGEPDTGLANFTKGKDCGNAVVVTHDGDWETQYCHLMEGSVAVKAGDTVNAGDVLGQIGFSGRTEFPHLHLSVRKNGVPVDPFGAQPMADTCDVVETDSLWTQKAKQAVAYKPGGIVDLGLVSTPPKIAEVRAGNLPLVSNVSAPALIIWARFFGVRQGDDLQVQLKSPSGEVLVRNSTKMTRNRAEEMRYAGKRATSAWTKGQYRAVVKLLRAGLEIDRKDQIFELR